MATVEAAPVFGPAPIDSLTAEDFETASIRSAAPSYVSEAPSYHSTGPNNEPIPAYTPRTNNSQSTNSNSTANNSSSNQPHQRTQSVPSLLPSQTPGQTPSRGLPPVPSGPLPPAMSPIPSLSSFRISPWSSMNANPTARHYQRVAHRRVAAQRSDTAALESIRRVMLDRIEEDERNRVQVRPLEDPYLVGEEAAARARAERLARESGEQILINEDKRWDFLLAQMNDWDERERSWARFRREYEQKNSHGKLARRLWGSR